MPIKELIKLILKVRKYPGAILIVKEPYYAECIRYGNCTNIDIANYTRGFDTSN